jgi:hypothetical protein
VSPTLGWRAPSQGFATPAEVALGRFAEAMGARQLRLALRIAKAFPPGEVGPRGTRLWRSALDMVRDPGLNTLDCREDAERMEAELPRCEAFCRALAGSALGAEGETLWPCLSAKAAWGAMVEGLARRPEPEAPRAALALLTEIARDGWRAAGASALAIRRMPAGWASEADGEALAAAWMGRRAPRWGEAERLKEETRQTLRVWLDGGLLSPEAAARTLAMLGEGDALSMGRLAAALAMAEALPIDALSARQWEALAGVAERSAPMEPAQDLSETLGEELAAHARRRREAWLIERAAAEAKESAGVAAAEGESLGAPARGAPRL